MDLPLLDTQEQKPVLCDIFVPGLSYSAFFKVYPHCGMAEQSSCGFSTSRCLWTTSPFSSAAQAAVNMCESLCGHTLPGLLGRHLGGVTALAPVFIEHLLLARRYALHFLSILSHNPHNHPQVQELKFPSYRHGSWVQRNRATSPESQHHLYQFGPGVKLISGLLPSISHATSWLQSLSVVWSAPGQSTASLVAQKLSGLPKWLQLILAFAFLGSGWALAGCVG